MFKGINGFACLALRPARNWKLLGWVLADGSLPFGELDAVDPLLAQYDYLHGFNVPPHQQPYGPASMSGLSAP